MRRHAELLDYHFFLGQLENDFLEVNALVGALARTAAELVGDAQRGCGDFLVFVNTLPAPALKNFRVELVELRERQRDRSGDERHFKPVLEDWIFGVVDVEALNQFEKFVAVEPLQTSSRKVDRLIIIRHRGVIRAGHSGAVTPQHCFAELREVAARMRRVVCLKFDPPRKPVNASSLDGDFLADVLRIRLRHVACISALWQHGGGEPPCFARLGARGDNFRKLVLIELPCLRDRACHPRSGPRAVGDNWARVVDDLARINAVVQFAVDEIKAALHRELPIVRLAFDEVVGDNLTESPRGFLILDSHAHLVPVFQRHVEKTVAPFRRDELQRESEFVAARVFHHADENVAVAHRADKSKLAECVIIPRAARVAKFFPLPFFPAALDELPRENVRLADLHLRARAAVGADAAECQTLLELAPLFRCEKLHDAVPPCIKSADRLFLVGVLNNTILLLLHAGAEHDAFAPEYVREKCFSVGLIKRVGAEQVAHPACERARILPHVGIFC